MTHERLLQLEKPPVSTLERFIEFSRNPLQESEWQDYSQEGDFDALKHRWIDFTDMLYGNEELRRITKNDKYKGVEGIKETLEDSLRESGRMGLIEEFSNQIIIIAGTEQISTVLPFLDKISDFNI